MLEFVKGFVAGRLLKTSCLWIYAKDQSTGTRRARQKVAGEVDSFDARVAHLHGHLAQRFFGFLLRQFDNHRKVYAGDDFDSIVINEHRGDVRGRASKRIGEEEHASATRDVRDGPDNHLSSRQEFTAQMTVRNNHAADQRTGLRLRGGGIDDLHSKSAPDYFFAGALFRMSRCTECASNPARRRRLANSFAIITER